MSFLTKIKSNTIKCNYQPSKEPVRSNLHHKIEKAASLIRNIRNNFHKCYPNAFQVKRAPSSPPSKKTANINGSITIEASIAIPFFIFFMMNLSSIFFVYSLYSKVDYILYENAKELSGYSYAYDRNIDDKSGLDLASDIAIGLHVQSKVNKEVENYPILDGSILLLGSQILEDDMISLVATYQVKPILPVIGFNEFRVMNTCKLRAFTGYKAKSNKEDGETTDSESETVYVTKSGKVYHRSANCSYIKVNLKSVSKSGIDERRSGSGAIYHPCEICGKSNAAKYFVTDYGTRYHTTSNCSSIKRDIIAISIEDVGSRGPCSKCGGG